MSLSRRRRLDAAYDYNLRFLESATCHAPQDGGTRLGLPEPFIAPSKKAMFGGATGLAGRGAVR